MDKVYRYTCRYCGMVHLVRMTEEQHNQLARVPSKVYDLLSRLMGCYKTMIHRGTCPTCQSERTVRPV
jgi:hypothetical protein